MHLYFWEAVKQEDAFAKFELTEDFIEKSDYLVSLFVLSLLLPKQFSFLDICP